MVSTDADLVCIPNITQVHAITCCLQVFVKFVILFLFFYYLLTVALGDPDTQIPQVPVPRERLHSPAR